MGLESIYFPARLVTFFMFGCTPERTTDHADMNIFLDLQVILILIHLNHILPACMSGIFAQDLIAIYG
jgi:hypothetical protein